MIGIWVATLLVSGASKNGKPDRILMNEFLFLALVIVYLAISYVPISQAPKDTWQSDRNERSSQSSAETDASTHL
jgi:hypothetical protein